MDPRFLNPADAERFLMEEVLYLHGLWRSGPPPNRKRNASPNWEAGLVHPGPAASRQPNLDNRWWSETPQLRGCDEDQNPVPAGEPTPGGHGWGYANLHRAWVRPSTEQEPEPCRWGDANLDRAWMRPSPEQEPEPCGWGVFKPFPASEPSRPPPPLSAEEQAERDAATALRSAMRSSKNYFAQKVKAGEDEDDSSDDDYNESDNVDEEVEEDNAHTRAFKFFIGLFEEDEVLREYYEKKREKGDFACLACAELGVRMTKTYKDCKSLLQHAFSIRKTKRQIEHRAFARAVCRVLGYNSSQLPSLVLASGDTLGQALAKARAANLENRWWSETPRVRGCDEAQNPVPAGEPTAGGQGWGDANLDRAWVRPSPEQEPEPSGWGVFKPSPAAEPSRPTLPLSAEEQAERNAATALRSAMSASTNYFARKVKAGEDEDDCSDSSDDDYNESDSVDEEVKEENANTRAFKFFIMLFEEDEVLREYYEKKSEKGNFACLACAELGVRKTKTYKDCNSLLQHAFSIRKTKRQIEHRAFARAVCRVLGYNSSRLPSLVLARGDTLGQDLAKARAANLGVQTEDATGND